MRRIHTFEELVNLKAKCGPTITTTTQGDARNDILSGAV